MLLLIHRLHSKIEPAAAERKDRRVTVNDRGDVFVRSMCTRQLQGSQHAHTMLLLVNYTSDIYNLKGQMQLYGHQRVTIAVVKLHLISSSVSEHLLGDQFAK